MQRQSLGFAPVCPTDLALRVLALICPPTNFVPGLGFLGSVELLSLDLSTRNRRGGTVGNVTQSPLTPEPLRLYETHPLVLRTRSYLETLGLPGRDPSSLPDASSRFADGGHYRIEIPTVNSLEAVLAVLDEGEKRGVLIHRITETLGFFQARKIGCTRHGQGLYGSWCGACDVARAPRRLRHKRHGSDLSRGKDRLSPSRSGAARQSPR